MTATFRWLSRAAIWVVKTEAADTFHRRQPCRHLFSLHSPCWAVPLDGSMAIDHRYSLIDLIMLYIESVSHWHDANPTSFKSRANMGVKGQAVFVCGCSRSPSQQLRRSWRNPAKWPRASERPKARHSSFTKFNTTFHLSPTKSQASAKSSKARQWHQEDRRSVLVACEFSHILIGWSSNMMAGNWQWNRQIQVGLISWEWMKPPTFCRSVQNSEKHLGISWLILADWEQHRWIVQATSRILHCPWPSGSSWKQVPATASSKVSINRAPVAWLWRWFRGCLWSKKATKKLGVVRRGSPGVSFLREFWIQVLKPQVPRLCWGAYLVDYCVHEATGSQRGHFAAGYSWTVGKRVDGSQGAGNVALDAQLVIRSWLSHLQRFGIAGLWLL